MIKFDEPMPTKSGEYVIKIWKELEESWAIYKKARIDYDLPKMKEYAKKIQALQDDLHITKGEFPELRSNKIKNI